MTELSPAQRGVLAHLRAHFAGHAVDVRECSGPVQARVPGFRVAGVAPGPVIGLWVYVSLGCWDAVHVGEHGLEFLLIAAEDAPQCVTWLAMAAHYHANPDESYRLDHGHTVPIGEPWSPGSACDHLLVSTPYPLGPDVEVADWSGGHARLLWLLPITEAERDFKSDHGLEALEQRLEEAALEYWDPHRTSVVTPDDLDPKVRRRW